MIILDTQDVDFIQDGLRELHDYLMQESPLYQYAFELGLVGLVTRLQLAEAERWLEQVNDGSSLSYI